MEVAKSVDDLMTSRSIEGCDFSDFKMLDGKRASALKKIISKLHFRGRFSVKEQHAQNYDRFLRERQIAYVIWSL